LKQFDVDSFGLNYVISTLKTIATENPYGIFTLLTPVFLVLAALSFTGAFGSYDIAIYAWALLSIIASLVFRGYNPNSIVGMQRAMVIVPVLVSHLFIRIHLLPKRIKGIFYIAPSLVVVLSVAINLMIPKRVAPNVNSHDSKVNTFLSIDIARAIESSHFKNKPYVLNFTANSWDSNLNNYTAYFADGVVAKSFIREENNITVEELENLNSDGNCMIIYAKSPAQIPSFIIDKYGFPEFIIKTIDNIEYRFERIVYVPDSVD
jgi:hypothetical protein